MYFLLRKNASREKIVRSYYILLLLGLLLYVTRRKVTETAMNLIYYPVARGQLDPTLCMRTSWVYQMIREPFFCSSLLTFLLDWNIFLSTDETKTHQRNDFFPQVISLRTVITLVLNAYSQMYQNLRNWWTLRNRASFQIVTCSNSWRLLLLKLNDVPALLCS